MHKYDRNEIETEQSKVTALTERLAEKSVIHDTADISKSWLIKTMTDRIRSITTNGILNYLIHMSEKHDIRMFYILLIKDMYRILTTPYKDRISLTQNYFQLYNAMKVSDSHYGWERSTMDVPLKKPKNFLYNNFYYELQRIMSSNEDSVFTLFVFYNVIVDTELSHHHDD